MIFFLRNNYGNCCVVIVCLYSSSYLNSIKLSSENFFQILVTKAIDLINKLTQDFKTDFEEGVFKDVNRALMDLGGIYRPNRDALYNLLDTVIINTKLVCLHVQNIVATNYTFPELDSLVKDTLVYADATIEALPRYFGMLTHVYRTFEALGYDISDFKFLPFQVH